MDYIAGTRRNPFAHDPECDDFVPGYGVTTADFHFIGDHPGIHGGLTTGIPFTDREWSSVFFTALERGGLLDESDPERDALRRTFFSYLYMCDPGDATPETADYAAMEPFLDAELRAITADVLLPVGARATEYVFENYTARTVEGLDMAALHGTELQGSGWLVVPILDPAEWTPEDGDQLVEALRTLQQTDYRRLADLGRFAPDDEPYFVR